MKNKNHGKMMGLLAALRQKWEILSWVYRNAHNQNLAFDCGSGITGEAVTQERVRAFHDLPLAELLERKQKLTAGQDAAFCETVDDFLEKMSFWYELKKYEHLISIVPAKDSPEYHLYEILQELKQQPFPFSGLGVAALHLHHGLRFAGTKIQNYVKNKIFIDAGAWEGDSASVFLQHYTPAKVYSFEISKANAEKYRQNMKTLGFAPDRYELMLQAPGKEHDFLSFCDDGSDGCSVLNTGSDRIEVVKLDDFMKDKTRPVGFIKADVEGSGLEMTKGAVEVLKKERPVLSLSIYHNPDEFFGIKPFIENLNLDYRFELQKHSPLRDTLEYVLFAYPAELEDKNA